MASVPVEPEPEQHSSDERQRSLAERGRLLAHLFKLMQQQQLQLMMCADELLDDEDMQAYERKCADFLLVSVVFLPHLWCFLRILGADAAQPPDDLQ